MKSIVIIYIEIDLETTLKINSFKVKNVNENKIMISFIGGLGIWRPRVFYTGTAGVQQMTRNKMWNIKSKSLWKEGLCRYYSNDWNSNRICSNIL